MDEAPWQPPRLIELDLVEDVSAAGWLAETLRPWWAQGEHGAPLSSLLPKTFAAYVRVLHPASQRDSAHPRRVRWAEVAQRRGVPLSPGMQFHSLAGARPAWPDPDSDWATMELPLDGCLTGQELSALAASLTEHTVTPECCWFCLWEGYGSLRLPSAGGPWRVEVGGRRYLLYRGPLASVTKFVFEHGLQSPNLWWPDDRKWVVNSQIDLYSTYVGGSEDCVASVLQAEELETIPVTIDTRVDFGSDRP